MTISLHSAHKIDLCASYAAVRRKWIKGQRISWLGRLERMEEDRMPKEIFTQELEGKGRRGRPRKGWKEEVERDLQVVGVRRWTEFVADRKKMEGRCSTGQSPQWAVVPMEEEEVYAAVQISITQRISINWMVSITEMQCVLCKVGTEFCVSYRRILGANELWTAG